MLPKSNYRHEIDSLRAIAVILVVLFHFFPKFFSKGYLGVDIFFVISGFVISFQIINSFEKKNFSYAKFYEKRFKRIIPVTVFTLLLTIFFSKLLLLNIHYEQFLKSVIAAIFFYSNIFFWRDGGYFGLDDSLKPLLHLWSLSVEEQFYLFFPIFFIFCLKFFNNKKIILILIFFSFVSLLIDIFLIRNGGLNPAFFLMPTRIWNFGLGVLAMLIFKYYNLKKYHNKIETILIFSLLIFGLLFELNFLPKNFLVIFSIFLLLSKNIDKKFFLSRILFNKHLRFIGLMSFSIYLMHWPIISFLKYYYIGDITLPLKFFSLVILFFLSFISYFYIEKKFRYNFNLKQNFSIILPILLVIIFYSFNYDFLKKKEEERKLYEKIARSINTNYRCEISSYTTFLKFKACIIKKSKNNKYDTVIIGNSHAQMYVPAIKKSLKFKNQNGILLIPATGCLPIVNYNLTKNCNIYFNNILNKILSDKNIKNIIIGTSWHYDQLVDLNNNNLFGKKLVHSIIFNGLLEIKEMLDSKNKNSILIGPIKEPGYRFSSIVSREMKFNRLTKEDYKNVYKVKRDIFDSEFLNIRMNLKKKYRKNFIDPSNSLCDLNFCYYGNKDGSFFSDSNHLSSHGIKAVEKNFNYIF